MSKQCAAGQQCSGTLKTTSGSLSVAATPLAPVTTGFGHKRTRSSPNHLVETVDFGAPLACPGYRATDPVWYQWDLVGAVADYKVTIKVAGVEPASVHFCFGSGSSFRTPSGRPAHTRKTRDSTRTYVGLLPPCPVKTAASGPCVAGKKAQADPQVASGVDTLITIKVPAGSDPWGRP